MKFDHLKPAYLVQDVAIPVATYCKTKFGKNGFKIGEEINPKLQWRPSIQLKVSTFTTLAIEVSDTLYPAILKPASYDLLTDHSDTPVVIYVACPLAVYQADNRQTQVSQLRSHGFGLFTVDDVKNVIEQVPAIPLIHYISEAELTKRLQGLPSAVRTKGRQAYDVYRMRSYQGLQDIAQVIEALVFAFAKSAKKQGWIKGVPTDAADVIDALYESTERKLKQQRAAIGTARGFIKYYRNISSHPPKSTVQAAKLIKNCRDGFFQALQVAALLTGAIRACGLKVHLHIP